MNEQDLAKMFKVEKNNSHKELANKRSYLLMRLQKAGFSTDQAHALIELVAAMTYE
jgi:hypothetical protein